MGMTIPQSKPLLINLEVNNKAYDLPTTASAVGIDLNTGKQLYYNTSSLGWTNQETITASYGIFSQNVTASNLLLTGNPGKIVNEVGPLLISSSLGITTSGSIIFSGSRSDLGTEQVSVLVNGDIFVSGGIGTNDYLQLKPVSLLRIPTNTTASYIYTSGSTNDLYFTQYSGPYTNTTRLRWLEGSLSTGLLNGGVLSTTNGTTAFNVSSGSGIIVSFNASTATDPYPTIKKIDWPTSSSIPLYNIGSSLITYVGIDNDGKVIQRSTPFAQTDYQSYIKLGRILHQAGSVTNGSITSPAVAYGTTTWNEDFNRSFGPLKISGHVLAPSGSGVTLALTKSAGDAYVAGRNYTVDPNSPNLVLGSVEGAQLTSKIFRIYSDSSGNPTILNNGNAGFTAIDPTQYNPGSLGVLQAVGSGKVTIQRVYWFPNSVNKAFYVYYGTTEYATLDSAQSSIPTDQFIEGNNTIGEAILVAYIIVAYNATNLNVGAQARILQAGLFRNNGVGGGGGGSTNPGGLDTYVQFNNNGTFGGDADFTFNTGTNTLTITNLNVTNVTNENGNVNLGNAPSDLIAVSGNLVFGEYGQQITLATGIDGGTTNFDFSGATIFYVSGATSDGTWNVTNVPTVDKIASKIKFVIDQGTVAHSASAYQFNGSSITVKWENGTIPTGTVNHTDVIEFDAYHSGSGWNILGSMKTFA